MSIPHLRHDFQKVTSHALALFAQKNNFSRIEKSKLNATFFHFIYTFRKPNDTFESEFEFIWKKFKNQILLITNNAGISIGRKLSYQQFLSQILYAMDTKTFEDSTCIVFYNMTISVAKKQKIRLLNDTKVNFKNIGNSVINWSIDILLNFSYGNKKKFIPFELFALLVNDSFLNYKQNKKLFIGKNAFNSFLMSKCITQSIVRKNRILNNKNDLFYRHEPRASDFFLYLEISQMDTTYSLPVLCDYFGEEAWYRFFIGSNETSYPQYFKFQILK